MIEIRSAKEIKGTISCPPSPDLLLLAGVTAFAAGKRVRLGPVDGSPLAGEIKATLLQICDIDAADDRWDLSPKSSSPEAVSLPGCEALRFADFITFCLLALGKSAVFPRVSNKRFEYWRTFARAAGCDVALETQDSSGQSLRLVSGDSFRMPSIMPDADMLHAVLGMAMGLKRSVNVDIDYAFSSPVRHLLSSLGYELSLRGATGRDSPGFLPRHLRLLRQPKKKTDQGQAFSFSVDFSYPGGGEAAVSVPGDDIFAGVVCIAKSLVQKGNLVIENIPLEPWATPVLSLVRKMGCRPAIQETHETSFGRTGMVQLQRFELAGRKTECLPLYHFHGHLPSMAVLACFSQGQSVFRGCEGFRIDEPDSVLQLLECISALGSRHGEMPDGMVIDGAKQLDGFDLETDFPAPVSAAFAVAGLQCIGTTRVAGGALLNRWPGFTALLDNICEYRK